MTGSNISNQLIVPITLWGSKCPTHCISTLIMTNDYKTIITGCNDGQILIWNFSNENNTLTPQSLLFGHTSAIICLANGKQQGDMMHFVSSSESGELSLWDLCDGRCIETIKTQHIHTNIHTYIMNHDKIRFFCNGFYAEIIVIDGLTLELLFTLNSNVSPDWISAIHVLRPTKSQDDVVIGVSIAGILKCWTLSGHEMKSAQPIYENESRPIRCVDASQMKCCCFNQRTMLVVSAKNWQIYDVGDFAMLCLVDNRRGERWAGGDWISADRVVIWNDLGKAYLYKLPTNCIPNNNEYRNLNSNQQPYLFATLLLKNDQTFVCPPAMAFYNLTKITTNDGVNSHIPQVLIRGDSFGRLLVWKIPDISNWNLISEKAYEIEPSFSFSLSDAWKNLNFSPCGIIDTLIKKNEGDNSLKSTSSVYIPALGRLVCGREDGSIIIVSANQTIMLELLFGRHLTYEDWPHHQTLHGHLGRVNTLLYPHQLEERYDISNILSGGIDFSVCLWDIFSGDLLHRFSVHAGEITRMFVPPKDSNPRVLNCICSVASDHSVALISLKERKNLMLASRHLFPVNTVKFRPKDDFLVVGCIDGSVYLWQMETGHLDRILYGFAAEELLNSRDNSSISNSGDVTVNPAVHLFRGLRHRNLDAIRTAAARGLHNISEHLQKQRQDVIDLSIRSRSNPLLIQGLRTNPKDQESHLLFFDVESLIVQLLSEEYDTLSPHSMEVNGLTSNFEYKRFLELACSPDSNKLSGLLAKMKDTAENAAQKIQAKAESVGLKNVTGDISVGFYRKNSAASSEVSDSNPESKSKLGSFFSETHLPMEIARLLLSLLYAWGLDPELDKICELKLGLLKPLRPVCFGTISKGGHMSLLLPTYLIKNSIIEEVAKVNENNQTLSRTKSVKIKSELSKDLQKEVDLARLFCSSFHWELSTSITTNHLLSTIALGNTFMVMNNATFSKHESKKHSLIRKLSRQNSTKGMIDTTSSVKNNNDNDLNQKRQQIHDAWQLVAAFHCLRLPDFVQTSNYQRPLVAILARRWQDRCIEIRHAAKNLLLSELKSIGSKGRRNLVEEWSAYLPSYSEQFQENGNTLNTSLTSATPPNSIQAHYSVTQGPSVNSSPIMTPSSDVNHNENPPYIDEDDDTVGESEDFPNTSNTLKFSTSSTEGRRRQAVAIVLMGVIGAYYGSEIEAPNKSTLSHLDPKLQSSQRRRSMIDGFGGAGNYSLARNTSKALSYLLLAPPSNTLPYHTSLRRSAIDLIGLGFIVWEPYLDVSKILLSLLEFSCSTDIEQPLVPSLKFGLPLTPAADSARTARNALQMIADKRPAAFITTLAKEVTRYNTLQQQQQSLNIIPHQTVLYRSRPEILRNMEFLIKEHEKAVYDLIIESTDIILYSLDQNALKSKGLGEMFPPLCKFQNVTYCVSSKRVAVGACNGFLAIYELKTGKFQLLQAHNGPIISCSFSPDGKHLASFCLAENKISFWLTQAVGLFGLGNAQTRCIKSFVCPPISETVRQMEPMNSTKLVWVSGKIVILLFADGKEHRFCI